MLKLSPQGLLQGFRLLVSLWHREYHDSRIILEQQVSLASARAR